MRHLRALTAALIILTGMAGCGNFPASPLPKQATSPAANVSLIGKTYLAAPLDNATISVDTAAGTAAGVTLGATTSQGRFCAQVSSLPFVNFDSAPAFLPLTVKVTGGTYNGTAFDGTLLGYLSSFGDNVTIHANILTTLIVKYQRAAHVTFADATAAVLNGLGLSKALDLAGKLDNPNYWYLFNPTRFMALARANGGFDAFTDKITANLVGSKGPGFVFVGEGEGAPGIGSKFGKWIGENTCSGLVAWGVGEFMGWMLDGFSTQDPTQEILDNLTVMNNELVTIQTGINNLTAQVTQLLQTVNLEWANLIATYDSLNMSTEESGIQNQYQTLVTNYTTSNPYACTATGKAQAMQFAGDILSASGYDIDQQIYNIFYNMTGQAAGTNGALYDMTTQLIVQAQSGQDLLQCYYVLESYFGQLVAIQAQGLCLMIEAIHERQNTILPYTDNATQYYAKYQQQIDNETEIFLACVDRLVVSSINVQSELAAKFAYLPPETATIYNRADFVASQLSSVQPAGLNIRLIGDPIHVTDWVTNNRITANGDNLTVVPVYGQTTNNYAAVIPASTPGLTYYLEWTQNGSAYTFQKEDNISIVKLKLGATAPTSFTVTTPTGSQTIPVAWYNIDFQQISSPANNPDNGTDNSTSLYGSGVFYVRVLPTWQSDNGSKTQDTDNQWSTIYTPNPADVSVYIQSTPCELEWWKSAPITYTGGIHTTLCNGGTDNVTLAFSWNATQNTTNNWTTNQSGTGNQSLVCQSTSQQANNNTTVTSDNFTFKPNASNTVDYKVQQVLNSEYANGLEYGYFFTTNAWLNSVEVIPKN